MEREGEGKMKTKKTIEISRLKPSTVLLVETQNAVYELTVLEPISALCEVSGGEHFKAPQQLFVDCAAWKETCFENKIILGYLIVFISKGGNSFYTSKVKSVKIIGPNNSYSYELE